MAPHTFQEVKPERPKEIPGVSKSSRLKFQMKQDYIIIMTGSEYSVAVAQLKYHGALHPDTRMFFMRMQ